MSKPGKRSGRSEPERLEGADVEIGAAAKAKSIRFGKKPETDVEAHGETREGNRRVPAETDSGSVRHNLPDEVEPGVTYRNVEIGWRAEARIKDPQEEPGGEDG